MKIFNLFNTCYTFLARFFANLGSSESGARQMPRIKPSVPEIESDYDYCIGMPARFGACQIPMRKPRVPDPQQD
jgi:hypothetical protein